MVSPLRRLTFFSDAKKKISKKRLAPSVRPLAWARRSFATVSIRGHCPPVCFATTYMQRVRLRRTALRATPRMHTSTQPPEGAGGSRSKAAGELTLGLMSGEERVGVRRCALCRSEPARDDRLGNAGIQEARAIVDDHRRNAARSWLAPTGGPFVNAAFVAPAEPL